MRAAAAAVLVVLLSACGFSSSIEPPATSLAVPPDAQAVRIERVVDGDTVAVRAEGPGSVLASTAQATVRLLQIDTPESVKPRTPVQCFAREATDYAKALLPQGSRAYVTADRDPRDRFGRYLVYLWTDDGVFVNEALVRSGHARAVLYRPNNRHIELMRAAEREAVAARRGLWGACPDVSRPSSP